MPGYPQSRQAASQTLTNCVNYLKRNFKTGISDAKDLLDSSGNVKSFWYYDFDSFWASSCTFRVAGIPGLAPKGRAKCAYPSIGPASPLPDTNARINGSFRLDTNTPAGDVFQGLGVALHGAQDFYSHSNWGDTASPPYTIR